MQSLFAELKRRKVYQSAAFYAAGAWLLVQIATQVFPFFDLPAAWVRFIVIALVAGFPPAMVLSWFYQWTPKGLRREDPAEQSESIARAITQALDRRASAMKSLSLPNVPSSFEQSVAVLPFDDLSEARDQEYFADGLAEELLDLLAQVPQLRVVARTSSFAFKGKATDAATIAEKLKVATLLSGSVRRAGNQVRVGVQLIRAADSSTLWSQKYESEFHDVFAMQDRIARSVVTALRVKLMRTQRLDNPYRTEQTDAYDQFLRGINIVRRNRYDALADAIPLFRRALEIDPDYAPAHAGLAMATSALADFADSADARRRAKDEALAMADKAVELAPGLADGHVVRAQINYLQHWDWKSAEADLQQALMIDPLRTDALTLLALELANRGQAEEAFILISRATESDPLSVRALSLYGVVLAQLGSVDEARATLQRAIDVSPQSSFARSTIGLLELDAGNADAALEHFRHAGAAFSQAGIAMAEHQRGNAVAARAALDELTSKYAPGFAVQIAQVHARMGNGEEALTWLERAADNHDPGILRLRTDTSFASLRGQRRFAALLHRLDHPE